MPQPYQPVKRQLRMETDLGQAVACHKGGEGGRFQGILQFIFFTHAHTYVYIYIQNYIDTYPCARGCPNFDGEFRGLDDKPWNFWGLGEIQPSSGSAAAPPSRFSGHMGSPCGICGPNVAPRVKGWFRFTHSNAVIYAL